uniref:Peptidase S1 domain-containing protein n=1 Tax=Heliothis virescens TaxID=7102 RepID=A0A2A4JVW2_HELVI
MFPVLVFTLIKLQLAVSNDILDSLNFISHPVMRNVKVLDLNYSWFPSLGNYQVNAVPVTEAQYPWIARVVHSRTADVPHMCTAVCIDEAIFITASRCIYTLKVNHTTIFYMSKRFDALAFVVPSEPTKQAFDDIGFIVVANKGFQSKWTIIQLFDAMNRTDDVFTWFSELDMSYGNINYKVVGYAMKKGIHKIGIPERQFNLTELNVVVSMDLCPKILHQYSKKHKGFAVPCYHSCTFQQFEKNNDKCYNYHGVEGGAVFDTITNKLMGVATWGPYFADHELPVGFSVANSENFFKDFMCARRIRDDNGLLITKGYYQALCDSAI